MIYNQSKQFFNGNVYQVDWGGIYHENQKTTTIFFFAEICLNDNFSFFLIVQYSYNDTRTKYVVHYCNASCDVTACVAIINEVTQNSTAKCTLILS